MSPPDPEDLLEHSAWLRRFARALVRDDASADDLVQDAFGAAIASRRPIRDLRGFLGGAVRRLSAETRRKEGRRRRHEADHVEDRAVSLPGADEAAERVETMRAILDELGELPKAQRDALTLRYVDGLEPVEIAQRAGVSPATVRAHVSRGLAALRERLDRRHGGRGAWTAAFAPWIAPSGLVESTVTYSGRAVAPTGTAGAVVTTGVALMSLKIAAATLAPLAVLGLWIGLDRGDSPSVAQEASRDEVARAGDTSLADVETPAPRRPEVERGAHVPADAPPIPDVASASEATFPVAGVAVDSLTGEPVPELPMTIQSIDPNGMPNDAIHAGLRRASTQTIESSDGEATTFRQAILPAGHDGSIVEVTTDRDGAFRADAEFPAGRAAVTSRDGTGRLPAPPHRAVHEFPFPEPIPVQVGPTFRFAATLPAELEEADFTVHFVDENGPGFTSPQSRLRAGEMPWVRFPFAVTRLEGDGPWTVVVTEGSGLWRASAEVTRKVGIEPTPIALDFEPRGAIEFRVTREGGVAAPILFVDVEHAETGDVKRTFLTVEPESSITKGIARQLTPGLHRWTAGPRSGEVEIVAGELATVNVEIDYGGATFDTVVLIDATEVEARDIQYQRFVVVSADDVSNVIPVEAKRDESDPEGFWRVEVNDLPDGRWNLVPATGFSALRWEPRSVALTPGSAPETLVATSRGPVVTVTLTVRDADTNEPIGGAEIAWNNGGAEYAMVTTDDDGVGRSTSLPNEDESHALIRAPGYGMTQVRLVPAEDGRQHEVLLERGWRGLVRVMALEDFSVVSGVEVLVDGASAGWTGDDGFVWVDGDGPPELIELGRNAPPVLMSPFSSPGLDPGDPLMGWTFLVGRR